MANTIFVINSSTVRIYAKQQNIIKIKIKYLHLKFDYLLVNNHHKYYNLLYSYKL